ncbi:MAG TPA: ribosome biogenesis GTPase Der, partial [Williamwhitmania sp.]|nr:ribosome biogenesis GTPase Der [Williamwhitmania sp.]
DNEVARMLRKVTDKKVFLVVNKVDNTQRYMEANEFYSLGLGNYFAISSINGSGTGDLLDAVVDALPSEIENNEGLDELPKIAIVGKPNVGKSSLTNALLDEDRNIVTPIPGTTRDSILTRYNKFGHDFYLIDTAGLRKKGKVTEDLEFFSVLRSIRSIENADVCVLMLDATEGIESQDLNIFNLITRNRKGVVILVNKWDLVEKDNKTMKEYTEVIQNRIAPFKDVPILFVSANTKQRIYNVLDEIMHVNQNRRKRIPTSQLNEVMLPIIEAYSPPAIKGKFVKIKFVMQLPTFAPSFAFFCNLPQYVKEPYKRYLENKLREQFDFTGVPIQIFFRQK